MENTDPTTPPTTTTTPAESKVGACRYRDARRAIDVLMPEGIVAFGILDNGELTYGADESAGPPSAEDITKLLRALPQHVLTDAMIETKLGTKLRVQVVLADEGDSIAVVVHLAGHSCAKSTARTARRLLAKAARRAPRVPA